MRNLHFLGTDRVLVFEDVFELFEKYYLWKIILRAICVRVVLTSVTLELSFFIPFGCLH